MIEDLPVESDDPESEDLSTFLSRKEVPQSQVSVESSAGSLARRYVGELIQRVEYGDDMMTAKFVM